MDDKIFTMSMYLNKEDLYKAKAEYYEELYKKTLTTQKAPVAKLQCSDGLCVALKEAANCALWLLSQPELKDLIGGDWGDPIAIKEMLEKAGCVPSCEKANT
jgi:hypothetical protein